MPLHYAWSHHQMHKKCAAIISGGNFINIDMTKTMEPEFEENRMTGHSV